MSSHDVVIAASILASDFSNLAGEVRRAENSGVDWLHLDVMDGHFVDNISFGPAVVAAVRGCSAMPTDVHLMVTRPDHYFSRFAAAATNITVHVEAEHDVAKTLGDIRAAGCTAGLALNPGTEFESVVPFLSAIDLLLVMTVHPGFGGQGFIENTMEKVSAARNVRQRDGFQFRIEVDGGINVTTAKTSVENGADTLVAGTSLFGASDMTRAIAELRPTAR
ncbi:MAG: ribulose-phosphate 3-epimerase [Verrucomicrobiota bacterium]|nr:ribulose-phosphate 3-epimerase [Verrucomicrobiota bacterium]